MNTKEQPTTEQKPISDADVLFRGKQYAVTYGGLDRDTYEHRDGCLWLKNHSSPCQCGAYERASKVYYFKVPPT